MGEGTRIVQIGSFNGCCEVFGTAAEGAGEKVQRAFGPAGILAQRQTKIGERTVRGDGKVRTFST
jgi:hypothetical protein